MRYTNLKGFEKQLAASAPHGFCRLYVIFSADDFERNEGIDAVLRHIVGPDGDAQRFSGGDATIQNISDALERPTLFSPHNVVVADDAEKKLLEDLAQRFKEAPQGGYLVIGSRYKAGLRFAEAHGVVLDLLDEKPWERDKRWIEQLHEKARAAGKRLAPDAALWMIERLERDAALIASETEKLLSYCAERSMIERSDVESICFASRTHTLWQIAEDLVWNRHFHIDAADIRDSSFFYGVVASLRQQLMIGIKIHDLRQSGVPISEWSASFPKMWPKSIEKKSQLAGRLGVDYFRAGLDRLFDIELIAKSSTVPLDALFDLFRLRLLSYRQV